MFKKALTTTACLTTLLLSGCAFSGNSAVSTSGSSTSPLSKGNMGGVAHGGRQGIYNATVSLYAMNTSTANYGDTPTLYAQTKTIDANGDFAFVKGLDGAVNPGALPAWSCPAGASTATPGSATDPYMYLVASGGDTSGTGSATSSYNNIYAKLMVVLGDCASIQLGSLYTINEATTVASVVALQQFINPSTEAIGAPSTNTSGLTNAVGMLSNLIDTSHGEIMGCSAGACNAFVQPTAPVPGVTISVQPEQTKLNTLANILAACVSSNPNLTPTPTACPALLQNAIPPANPASSPVTNFPTINTYPAAADTLQAALYMEVNPTESQDYAAGSGKLYNLFSLSFAGTVPFAPALDTSSQPNDWTIGVDFVPSGGCSNLPQVTISSTPQNITLMQGEYGMAIDAKGNIWMGGSGGSATTSYDTLVELSPSGVPLNCLDGVPSGTSNNSAGRKIAIDQRGNVWWNTSQGVLEWVMDASNPNYSPTTGLFQIWPNPAIGGTAIPGAKPSGIAFDKNGNLFVSPDAVTTSTTNDFLYEYAGASTATTPAASVQIGNVALLSTGTSSNGFHDLSIDANGNLFTVGTAGTFAYVFQPSTASGNVGGYTDFRLTTDMSGGYYYGAAEDSTGTFLYSASCCYRSGAVAKVNANGTTASTAQTAASNNFVGGMNASRSVAVDGANNIWLGYASTASNAKATGTGIAEADTNFNAISPQGVTLTYLATGTVPNPATQCGGSPASCLTLGGYEKPFFGLSNVYAMGIDGSGNVWGANQITTTAGTATQGDYWVIVGTAVPVVTPLSNNIH